MHLGTYCRLRGDGVEFFRRRRKCSRCWLDIDVGRVKQGMSIPLYCRCISGIFHTMCCNVPVCFRAERHGSIVLVGGIDLITCLSCGLRGSEMQAVAGSAREDSRTKSLFFLCHSHTLSEVRDRFDYYTRTGWSMYLYGNSALPFSRYRGTLWPIGNAEVVEGQLVLSRG